MGERKKRLRPFMDGIWPSFVSEDGRTYVSKYGRGDWRVTVFDGVYATSKRFEGRFTTKRAALAKAKAA